MSNINTNLKTQTSNALHNAIMEAGGKDHPLMLAPGNYNPPYKFKWIEKIVPLAEGIDNDIYSTVDPCPNACEMWKAIERLKQAATRNRGKAIVNSPPPTYDPEPALVTDDDEISK
ncbi:hypothetical protein Tco_0156053 [Tanacetum coccineum]